MINAFAKKREPIAKTRPVRQRPPTVQSSSQLTAEEPGTPDTSQIPLFDSVTHVVPSMEPKAHSMPDHALVMVENATTDGVGRTLHGLYATPVESGESSKVFGVETRLSLNKHLSNSKDVVRKVCLSLFKAASSNNIVRGQTSK